MTAKDMLVTETQELADSCESISQPDKKKINKIMLNTLGVVRNRKRMEEELEKLCQIKGSLSLLGQAAIMSAIERTESRGAHYREDYPKKMMILQEQPLQAIMDKRYRYILKKFRKGGSKNEIYHSYKASGK